MFLKALPKLQKDRLHSNGLLKQQGENPDFDPDSYQPFNTNNVNANNGIAGPSGSRGPSVIAI